MKKIRLKPQSCVRKMRYDSDELSGSHLLRLLITEMPDNYMTDGVPDEEKKMQAGIKACGFVDGRSVEEGQHYPQQVEAFHIKAKNYVGFENGVYIRPEGKVS
jgi:hypothetical protein